MQIHLIGLSRRAKQAIVAVTDVLMSLAATWAAFSLRLDMFDWPQGYQWHVYVLSPLLALPVFVRFGLYRAVFRYTGVAAMVTMGKAVALYAVVFFLLLVWLAMPGVPRSVGLLQPLLFLLLVGGSRIFARFWLTQIVSDGRQANVSRLLIYGGGAAGAQIADVLLRKKQLALIGFVDDDPQLRGKTINGQRVYSTAEMDALVARYAVTDVLLAMPRLTRGRRNEIISTLRKYQVHVRSLPDMADLAQGKVTVSDIRELEIADLLGREPVPPNPALISRNIRGKVVCVTGAGGSIGSELCRQILAVKPAKLLLLDHGEYNLYSTHAELERKLAEMGLDTELIPLLGSVRDFERIRQVCTIWRPHTIYHAAAYKHVPLVEQNPAIGIGNNVFGTLNVARAAMESGVADFVLISTDKAVRPTNIMGATKRLAEMILQALAAAPSAVFGELPRSGVSAPVRTRFSMVRFGNVLGSSGSVVPLFRQQIKDGGPLTVTDSDVTRYFMTIPEAAQLVVQAAAMAEGGDVFVLDMGEPVRIIDLAYRIVELSGLKIRDHEHPDGDIEISVTGLRPGEKLYEELLIGEDPQPTAHPRIMKAHEDFLPWDRLQAELQRLSVALELNDVGTIKNILQKLVAGYEPAPNVVDWVYLASEKTGDKEFGAPVKLEVVKKIS